MEVPKDNSFMDKSNTIVLSVIVPTIVQNKNIIETIDSIYRQVRNRTDCELIVVDNRIDYQSNQAIDLIQMCQSIGSDILVVSEPSPGLSTARHAGFHAAKGSIIAYIDDDVLLSDSWVEAALNVFQDPTCVIAGGPSLPVFDQTPPEWYSKLAVPTEFQGWMNPWYSILHIPNDSDNLNTRYIWGLNFLIRRETLVKFGGFCPDLVPKQYQVWQGNGESGLTLKLSAAGIRARYRSSLLVYHRIAAERLTYQYLSRRSFYSGVCESFELLRPTSGKGIGNPLFRRLIKFKVVIAPFALVASKSIFKFQELNHCPRVVIVVVYKLGILCEMVLGFQFHQKAVKSSSELREWVQSDSFLDRKIPLDDSTITTHIDS
jgi:glycosyltransferase involved in cell wall biosynthesis